MIDADHWDELELADKLRLVALEAEAAAVERRYIDAIHEAADRLEFGVMSWIDAESGQRSGQAGDN